MISDVLYECLHDIEEYQHMCPEWYADLEVEIVHVKTVMTALLVYLDSCVRQDEAHRQLGRELLALEVNGLKQAIDNLEATPWLLELEVKKSDGDCITPKEHPDAAKRIRNNLHREE